MGTAEKPAPLVWLVGGSYSVLDEMWNHIREWAAVPGMADLVERMTNKPMELDLKGAGRLRGKSADDPDLLRGPALDKLVIEEAEGLSDYAINRVFLPMFTVTRGGMIAISSPRRKRHWFYQWYLMGQDGEHPEVRSFTNSSYDNPDADKAHIDFMKTILTEAEFLSEYMGEFPEDEGQVFRRVKETVGVSQGLATCIPGKPYVIGVDWAKVHDFTVFVVGDVSARSAILVERFHKQDYNLQVSRLKDLATRFNNAHVLMDSTGIGDPILDMVRKAGIRAQGYTYTWRTKKQAIDALAVAIEHGELRIPDHPQLLRELEAYEQLESDSGNVKYGAPRGEGYYDDCVSALALTWWLMRYGADLSRDLDIRSVFDPPAGQRELQRSIFGG